jgi:hypothetical protein
MTSNQRIALNAEWWPTACRAQGWKTSDRDRRLRVCAWAVSLKDPTQLDLLNAINSDREPARILESTNDLDSKEDIDRVKACLLMLADDVEKTKEVGKPLIGSARRKRDVLRDLIKCIGVYHPRPRAYVAEIINDKFNAWRKYGEPLTIRDLTDDPVFLKDGREIPSQLDQLLYTVSACLNGSGKRGRKMGFRLVAKDSLHDMKMKAGVHCDCMICVRRGLRRPEPPQQEDWTDFEPELEMAIDEFGGTGGEEGSDNPF